MSIAKQAVATFGTKIVSFIFYFIGSIFLTRLLGVEGKGVQAFINANVFLFSTLFGLNIFQTLTYFIAKRDFNVAAARGFALSLNIFGFFLFSSVIFFLYYNGSQWLNFIIPEAYQSPFFVMYLLILFLSGIMTPFFEGNWQGQAKFGIINSLILLTSLLNAILYSVAWFFQQKGTLSLSIEEVLTISLVITLTLFLIRVVILFWTREEISLNIKNVVKPMLLFTGIAWVTRIMSYSTKRIDFWFIEYYQGLEELGYYSLASSLVDIIATLILPATFVISPYLTKANTEDREIIIGRFSRIAIALMSGIVFVSFFLIKPMIPILYGDAFIKSILPLQILFFGTFVSLIGNIFGVYNIATNNMPLIFRAVLIAFLFTIISDVIFIPKYGMVAASIISSISYSISAMIIMVVSINKFKHHPSYFLLFKKSDYYYLLSKIKDIRLNK